MANLHRYRVRQQAVRLILIDARSKQEARAEAEKDVIEMGDADIAIARGATLIEENVGVDTDPQQSVLDRWEVPVIIRRNISMDAEGKQEARQYSKDDQNGWGDTVPNSIITQRVQFIQSNAGVA